VVVTAVIGSNVLVDERVDEKLPVVSIGVSVLAGLIGVKGDCGLVGIDVVISSWVVMAERVLEEIETNEVVSSSSVVGISVLVELLDVETEVLVKISLVERSVVVIMSSVVVIFAVVIVSGVLVEVRVEKVVS